MSKTRTTLILLIAIFILSGCGTPSSTVDIKLEQVAVLKGFAIPESVALDVKNDRLFVSCCNGDPKRTWVDDGDGYISTINRKGKDAAVVDKKWLESKPKGVLNDPKGMAVFDDYLYICDNKRVLKVPLDKSKPVEEVKLGTPEAFADPLVFEDHLYIGCGAEKVVFRIAKDGLFTRIKGLGSINGLAGYNGKLYAVTWGSHEIFELDPEGIKDPVSFGLAKHFVNLDGIDNLKDGTFIISDFKGHAIYGISPDRKTVKKLATVETPADLIVDHESGLLYVPSYYHEKVTVYRIHTKVKESK